METKMPPLFIDKAFWQTWLKCAEIMGSQALAGVAQQIEHQSVNQGIASSIPHWGTCLGCRLGPQWWGGVRGNHTLMFFSLSFSLLSPL